MYIYEIQEWNKVINICISIYVTFSLQSTRRTSQLYMDIVTLPFKENFSIQIGGVSVSFHGMSRFVVSVKTNAKLCKMGRCLFIV